MTRNREAPRTLEITAPLRGFQLVARLVELLLQALNCTELFLLARQCAVSSAERRSSSPISCSTFSSGPWAGSVFSLQRFAFDLELDDPAVELVERFRLRIDFHPQAAPPPRR